MQALVKGLLNYMFESWRHAEWETGAHTSVRTDRVGHRRRQLLKLLPAMCVMRF